MAQAIFSTKVEEMMPNFGETHIPPLWNLNYSLHTIDIILWKITESTLYNRNPKFKNGFIYSTLQSALAIQIWLKNCDQCLLFISAAYAEYYSIQINFWISDLNS